MANYKRKRPRAQVRCTMCTSGRVEGNSRNLNKGVGRGPRASKPGFWPTVKDSTEQ